MMQRTKTAFTRLTALDRAIREGRHPNALTFSAEYEVSQKTVQRDIDFLREQGAPLGYDRERKGYYYTDINWFLPALNLNQEELQALLLAKMAGTALNNTPVVREYERILGRLIETLPSRPTCPPELVFERFSFIGTPAGQVAEKTWQTMATAVLTSHSVRIAYHSANTGQDTERVIDPYHLTNLQGEWYVLAWCHTRERIQQFSVAQVREVSLLKSTFEVPARFNPQQLLGSVFRRQVLGDDVYEVRLRFDKSVAESVTKRNWQPRQKAQLLRNGSVELSFPAVGLFEVSRWVLSWGSRVRVIAPTKLKAMVSAEIKQMKAQS
jgi:predicted DNA-binding transcriptional regulator YafY